MQGFFILQTTLSSKSTYSRITSPDLLMFPLMVPYRGVESAARFNKNPKAGPWHVF